MRIPDAGTSEGAIKAWKNRERAKKEQPNTREKSVDPLDKLNPKKHYSFEELNKLLGLKTTEIPVKQQEKKKSGKSINKTGHANKHPEHEEHGASIHREKITAGIYETAKQLGFPIDKIQIKR